MRTTPDETLYKKLRVYRDTAEQLKILAALHRQPMIVYLETLVAEARQQQTAHSPHLQLIEHPPAYHVE